MKKSISEEEYKAFSKKGKLSCTHWLAIVFSLVITFIAFSFSNKQVVEKEEKGFLREFDKVNNLISERMEKYEDGLSGGASCIQSHGGTISYDQWLVFFNSLKIDKKYPGVNGIGLIENVKKENIDLFTERMRRSFPDFKIHPDHNEQGYFNKDECWPIVSIEPIKNNLKALGIDMSHEKNRFTSLKKACELRMPQITGPITLVHDEGKTSGFLFFFPYYNELGEILGIVYAQFVVDQLISGALSQYNLHVTVSISDDTQCIYNEHNSTFMNSDPNPLYVKKKTMHMYGRNWTIDVRSNKSFRDNSNQNQPIIILFGGILVDILLLLVFITLTKSNKKAILFADRMSKKLNIKNKALEHRNTDLETLLHVSSHDLREPIRAIKNFSNMISLNYKGLLDKKGKDLFFRIERGANKMDKLLDDILTLSHAQRKKLDFESVNCKEIIDEVLLDLEDKINNTKATVKIIAPLPIIYADKIWVKRAFFNLINNALKFVKKGESPDIEIDSCFTDGRSGIKVSDRGIGVKKGIEKNIFSLFQRGVSKKVEGTGAGLAIVEQVAFRHKGKAWVNPRDKGGSEFNIVFLNRRLYDNEENN